jgi:SAM-dependent methyltransferase
MVGKQYGRGERMSKYVEINYPPDEKNQYPQKLADHLFHRFIEGELGQGKGSKILDIGCSTGKALKMFNSRNNLELYGIDLRDEGQTGFVFKECNLESEEIPFEDDTFDFIYNKSVLEHVRNTDNFISESFRVLKPGGIFIGLVPDWASQYKSFWDDYTHVKPFTLKGLRNSLLIYGFEEVNCEYFYQLPFIWKHPSLTFIPKIISLLPDSLKWKDKEQRNTKDRKLVRFSKEKMLLVCGRKPR